jgi:hypothetical protein
MPDRDGESEENDETGKRLPGGQVHLKPAGEARVTPLEAPDEPPADKRIHPRRPLPLVPEGPVHTEEDQ